MSTGYQLVMRTVVLLSSGRADGHRRRRSHTYCLFLDHDVQSVGMQEASAPGARRSNEDRTRAVVEAEAAAVAAEIEQRSGGEGAPSAGGAAPGPAAADAAQQGLVDG